MTKRNRGFIVDLILTTKGFIGSGKTKDGLKRLMKLALKKNLKLIVLLWKEISKKNRKIVDYMTKMMSMGGSKNNELKQIKI